MDGESNEEGEEEEKQDNRGGRGWPCGEVRNAIIKDSY